MIYIFCIPCTFLLPSHSSWSSPLPISILLPTVDIGDLDPTIHGVLIYFFSPDECTQVQARMHARLVGPAS